jgi:Methyltransferase domain
MTVEAQPKRRGSRLAYAARAGRAFTTQPYEALERFREKVAERRDERCAPYLYHVDAAGEETVHRLIRAEYPCREAQEFRRMWAQTLDDLHGKHLEIGRGAFGGWDDGDSRLVRLAWCLVAHLRPENVVETGVARGLTSRALLEGLERNDNGHLWSIDLPPLLEHGLAEETGIAVPERLHPRWTLVSGSSRSALPELVGRLGEIQLFVHDSMHTTRNVRFELEQVWPALAPGGVALIDDVEKNSAMGDFLQVHPGTSSMVCAASDGDVRIGCLVKAGRLKRDRLRARTPISRS